MFTQGRIRVVALALADGLCVVSAWVVIAIGYKVLGALLRANGWPGCPWGGYDLVEYTRFLLVAVVFVCVNAAFDLYHGNWMYPSAPLSPVEEFRRLCLSSLLTHGGVIAYIAFAYQTTDSHISRAVCVYSCLLTAAAAQSFRNWMRFALHRLDLGQIPVVLAGSGETMRQIASCLEGNAHAGVRIVGYFSGADKNAGVAGAAADRDLRCRGIPHLGTLRDIVPESRKRGVRILFACQDERLLRAQMNELAAWFTHIDYLPTDRTFPIFGARAVSFGGIGGLEMVNQGRMRAKVLQKSAMDWLFAFVAFVVFLPAFAIIPLIVKITSRGPVFYRHRRLGRNGRVFRIWKFRSMYVDADERLKTILASDPAAAAEWESSFKLKRDPRVTPFGRFLRKTSLDELPQLFNVFSGEMALIGPRPIIDDEVRYYGDAYKTFASVKPGITGLWQVSGRSDTDYAQRVALDTYYVLNWSPWLDLWILVRTAFAVLLMRGAR